MVKKHFALYLAFFILNNFLPILAQKEELDKEIARLKKEIEKVETQRKEEAREAKKDREDFDAYNQRTLKKKEAIKKQIDSIKIILKELSRRNDSINGEISSIGLKIREYDLQKENIKSVLLKTINNIISQLHNFPPLLEEQYSGSLRYLSSELEVGNTESAEALYRLTKIVGEIRTASQEIQLIESNSPIPQIKGSVYRLRIGGIFESLIEKEGRDVFIWNYYSKKWLKVEPSYLDAFIKAVKIKEGKMIPELVDLPLGDISYEERGGK